jgi:hypothetical protein
MVSSDGRDFGSEWCGSAVGPVLTSAFSLRKGVARRGTGGAESNVEDLSRDSIVGDCDYPKVNIRERHRHSPRFFKASARSKYSELLWSAEIRECAGLLRRAELFLAGLDGNCPREFLSCDRNTDFPINSFLRVAF